MAARAMWKGVVRMGDVAIPVKLYSAVEDRSVRFRLLERRSQTPVSQKMIDPVSGEVVPYEDTRRGYPTGDDELVLLEPDASRDIEVVQFVPPETIDHRWYVRPYYLGPDGDVPRYTALAAALAKVGREGVAHWTMRKKAYVGALRLRRGYPVLVTLRSVEEVVPVEQVERPAWKALDDRQLKMSRQLLAMLEAPFEADAYRDSYRERVEELIAAKREGERSRRTGCWPRPWKMPVGWGSRRSSCATPSTWSRSSPTTASCVPRRCASTTSCAHQATWAWPSWATPTPACARRPNAP